jgi:hypothetical protein
MKRTKENTATKERERGRDRDSREGREETREPIDKKYIRPSKPGTDTQTFICISRRSVREREIELN